MAKNCINPLCRKEIPSSATFCLCCGTQQVENENLSDEEKLRKEKSEMQETIQVLKKALANAQQNDDSASKKNRIIEDLQMQLTKAQEIEKNTVEKMAIVSSATENKDYNKEEHEEQNDTRMFRNPFSVKGRIRRTEFCLSYLIYIVYYLPMSLLEENEINEVFAVIWLLLFIPMIWFLFAQGAKRCHDRDNSGWYQIIPLYIFWMLFAEGDDEENDYGNPPK